VQEQLQRHLDNLLDARHRFALSEVKQPNNQPAAPHTITGAQWTDTGCTSSTASQIAPKHQPPINPDAAAGECHPSRTARTVAPAIAPTRHGLRTSSRSI